MKKKHGVTLIELIVAMAVSVIIILSIGAVSIFVRRTTNDANAHLQAVHNASSAMEFITKKLLQRAGMPGAIAIEPLPDEPLYYELSYLTYGSPPDFSLPPSVLHTFYWHWSPEDEYYRTITYWHTDMTKPIIIARHISDCRFEPGAHGGLINITIEALDNNDNPAYDCLLHSSVEARYMPEPAVY